MIECQNLIKNKYNLDSYKLKNYNVKEVTSIRILQIFYSVIYNNQYISNLIEKNIEDILKNERTADIDPLSCTQIIQNKIFIFQSSFVKGRGQLINLNTAKLAKFFNQAEEQIMQIYHCEQIMPNFIAEIHDTLINKYIKKGFTTLQVQSQQTFLKNIEGYLEQCVLNLMNYYDIKNNDFIMNALISKIQSQESIIFGVDGVILGCTQTFFQQVIKSNYHYVKDSLKNLNNENHNNLVQLFFEQSPLIQLFIPNIIQQIEELQQQYFKVKQLSLTNQKSSWIYINDYANIYKQSLQNMRRFKSKNNKQFQHQNSNEGQLDADEEIYYEKNENLTINDIPITLLQPYLRNQFIQDLTYEQISNSQAYELSYDIIFNSYISSNNQLGYFFMNIKDIKSLDLQKLNKQNQIYQIISPPKERFEQSQNNLYNCQSNSQDFGKEFKTQNDFNYNTQQQNVFIQSLSALSENQKQQNQIKSSDTIANLETFRGVQITNNQIDCNLLNIDKNYIDSQVISEQVNKFQYFSQQQIKDMNTNTKRFLIILKMSKHIFLDRIQSHKQSKEEENNDFKSNPSKTSVSSSQREIQILVEQLYSKQQLITPLKIISSILIIAFILIYLSIILNYSVTVMLLQKQTNGVLELIQPQNITYFYSSIYYQLWAIELDMEGIVPLSEFQRQRNIQSVQSMYDNARIYMKKLNINIPLSSQNQGIYEYIVRYIINDELQIKSMPIETFYYMIYEISEFQFRVNLDAIEPCYDELHTHGFLRQNIVYLTQQISNLVDNINNKTISDQEQALPVFQSYLAIEISIVTMVFFLQLKYWLLFDKIQKRILLLISTLNEFQSQEQIYKLQQVKYFLNNNNYSNWKVINFCEIMGGNVSKKTIQLSLHESQRKGQSSDSSLQNRIQKTQFKTKLNYMFMILLGLSYALYLITSYIIYIQQFNNFQPSLIATLKYGQFRTKMDITSFVGGFIKTEALLLGNNISQINQTEVIELFKQNKDSLLQLIFEVSQAILENAQRNDKTSRFDDFLHGDICELRPWETLKACDLTRQNLSYSSKDNLKYLLSQGILGYTAAFLKYLNSDFDYEIENNRYNTNQQNSFEVLSQQFENFFLSYFCEIQDTFLEFLNLFKIDNQEIADAIIFVLQLYYLLFGTFYLIIILCISTFLIIKQQQKIMFLRQILALIPCELIQNPNMKTRTKLIYAWLY